jgi:hypothetical protein
MLKIDVLKRYNGNQSEVARALNITRASVNGWGEIVPPYSAKQLAELNPDIPYDPEVYKDWNSKFGRRARKQKRRH